MLEIRQAITDADFRTAWELRSEMGRWDSDQARQLGLDPTKILSHFYSIDVPGIRHANAPPRGGLLLATVSGAEAGCASFRRIDTNAFELHHVFVREQFRGKHIGRQLVEQIPEIASTAGYQSMLLETTTYMREAQNLYASIGFRTRGSYYDLPSSFENATIFMELLLASRIHP